jgi:4-diphosphocytidyl-2-C-methyl-D-erythritol kinase
MSEKTISLQAPAKINLSLRVLGKRDDGYHDIETLMTRVPGLYDVITLTESKSFSFVCETPGVPTDDTNLVVKATKVFEKLSKKKCKATVTLEKNIPHGAGLGGGSSDAASTLLAWNQWHNDVLSHEKLLEAAALIGSDVPFFLGSSTARCTGRGEILTAVANIPKTPIVIFKPAISVSTPDAYKRWQAAIALPGVNYDPIEFPWAALVNDLEKPVFGKFLFLAELKNWLNSRPEVRAAIMSGSGSAMFAILSDESNAEALIQTVRDRLDPEVWAWSGVLGG